MNQLKSISEFKRPELVAKAIREDNYEWIVGYPMIWSDGTASIETGETDEPQYAVVADTICRCTGIKDRNGTYIFENDVVYCDKPNDILSHVYYKNGTFKVMNEPIENHVLLNGLFNGQVRWSLNDKSHVNMAKANYKMTLEEAIQRCYEISNRADNYACRKELLQLAEWLEELQERRKQERRRIWQEGTVVDTKQR